MKSGVEIRLNITGRELRCWRCGMGVVEGRVLLDPLHHLPSHARMSEARVAAIERKLSP
jgi:hypothetical protein